jgi:hypothetical protein
LGLLSRPFLDLPPDILVAHLTCRLGSSDALNVALATGLVLAY